MKMRALLLHLTLLAFALGGARAENWGAYQHDTAHTGRSNATVKPVDLALAWSAPNYTGSLIIGDTLYAKSYHGLSTAVAAFSVADGRVKWNYRGDNIYFGSMAAEGQFVVLEGFDFGDVFTDTLTVLDRATGQFRYKLEIPFSFALLDFTLVRDPVTGDVIAYCSDGGTLLKILILKDGAQILWTQSGDLGSSSIPAIVGDSVVVVGYGNGYAFDRTTGAKNNFFVDPTSNLNGGAPVACNARRGEFYFKVDYSARSETKVRAFRYNNNSSIQLLWTRTTPYVQFGGTVTIGPDDNLYVVGSGEIAILNPDDGSTIKSIPFPFVNGCGPILTRRVLWVYSDTQTYAYDSQSLELLRVFNGSAGFNLGFDSLGAFVPGTAAFNLSQSGVLKLDVYRQPE